MNSKTVPSEIKVFNWGAFLLSTLWSIRYGVWIGLLNLIPVFGFIISLILGFKGNEWAWEKNNFQDTKIFLASQKRWGRVAIALYLLPICFFGVFWIYMLNYSGVVNQALDIANHNNRVVTYFGSPINKPLIFVGSVSYKNKNGLATSSVKLRVNGTKNSGYLSIDRVKFSDHWVTTDLSVSSEKDNHKMTEIINLSIESTVDKKSPPDIVDILKKFKTSQNEEADFLIIKRSEVLNDFMQARLGDLIYREPCYIIEYSNGYTPENNKMYVSTQCYADVNEVADIFYSYMTGKDDFMAEN